MQNRALALLGLVLVGLLAAVHLFWHPRPPDRPLPRFGLPIGGDFVLNGPQGAVALGDFRGSAVVLRFGGEELAPPAPTVADPLSDALAQLDPDERRRVTVIIVSAPPGPDGPADVPRAREVRDHPSVLALTGTTTQVFEIAARYGVLKGSGASTAVDAEIIFLVGVDGRLVDRLNSQSPVQLATAIRRALKST